MERQNRLEPLNRVKICCSLKAALSIAIFLGLYFVLKFLFVTIKCNKKNKLHTGLTKARSLIALFQQTLGALAKFHKKIMSVDYRDVRAISRLSLSSSKR